MKHPIKIKKSHWVQNSDNKMIHETIDGKFYYGPPIPASPNDIVLVESSDMIMEDGYYHINKIIHITRQK